MTGTTAVAAAEPASEPALLDLESWGPGTESSVLASSAPNKQEVVSVLLAQC